MLEHLLIAIAIGLLLLTATLVGVSLHRNARERAEHTPSDPPIRHILGGWYEGTDYPEQFRKPRPRPPLAPLARFECSSESAHSPPDLRSPEQIDADESERGDE